MTGRGAKGSDESKSKSKKYKRQEKGTSKNDDNCKECNKLISSEVKALNCNFCHKWVCADCLEISDVLYEMLVHNPKAPLLVPCKDCSRQVNSLQDMRATLDEVRQNQVQSQKELAGITSKVDFLKEELKRTIASTVKKEVDEQLTLKLDRVEKNLEDRMDTQLRSVIANTGNASFSLSDQISEKVAEEISEYKEREKRRQNLMIFNVPELNSKNRHERVEYDYRMVIRILSVLLDVDDLKNKIKKVLRLGVMTSDENKRPIKVIFDQPDTKYSFLQKAYKLKSCDDETLRSFQISNDRTPKELAEYRKLHAELVEREKKGETDLRIRRGKIIRLKEESKPRYNASKKNYIPVVADREAQGHDSNNDSESDPDINASQDSHQGELEIESASTGMSCRSKTEKYIPVRPLEILGSPTDSLGYLSKDGTEPDIFSLSQTITKGGGFSNPGSVTNQSV